MAGTVLWDVDTQVDFVDASGELPVPGAEALAPAFARLVGAAREAGIPHVASADDHEPADPELSDDPDYATTYPPHCLRGTRGAEKVPETTQRDPLRLSPAPLPPERLVALAAGHREFLLLKKSFDVFANPNAEPLLELLDPDEVVVFGVATDVCDDATIRGLLDRGRNVSFVEDAARGLDEARTAACTGAWRERGVRFTTVAEVIDSLG